MWEWCWLCCALLEQGEFGAGWLVFCLGLVVWCGVLQQGVGVWLFGPGSCGVCCGVVGCGVDCFVVSVVVVGLCWFLGGCCWWV